MVVLSPNSFSSHLDVESSWVFYPLPAYPICSAKPLQGGWLCYSPASLCSLSTAQGTIMIMATGVPATEDHPVFKVKWRLCLFMVMKIPSKRKDNDVFWQSQDIMHVNLQWLEVVGSYPAITQSQRVKRRNVQILLRIYCSSVQTLRSHVWVFIPVGSLDSCVTVANLLNIS